MVHESESVVVAAASFVSTSPHPLFDPDWYREQNPDLRTDQISFGHYLSEGWRQGRSPHPLFSVQFYLEQRPDVHVGGDEPLTHFIVRGWKEGANPHPQFDVAFYLSQSPDLGLSDPLTHFITVGREAGLLPNRIAEAGLQKRIQFDKLDIVPRRHPRIGPAQSWCIMTTPHTIFIAHLIAQRLRFHGWTVEIRTTPPTEFIHDMYFVICPQMFSVLPPGERRISFQMEQSVSSRWFNDEYFNILENSKAVLDYSLSNIEFLEKNGIAYPMVYYIPIGALEQYLDFSYLDKKICDVLFYGDAASSPRRRRMLDIAKKHFNVRLCSEVFGPDMWEAIRGARVVLNIHYYENALLEMPRIQECLSLGVPVVSEAAHDQSNYPEISEVVRYFNENDEQSMVLAIEKALRDPISVTKIEDAVAAGARRFEFMFDRFLLAENFLEYNEVFKDSFKHLGGAAKIVLSMPETIARRRAYEAEPAKGFTIFDGLRKRPGWVGCGLSYTSLGQYAIAHNIGRLTVIEDDVLLPSDFEEKMHTVNAYLDSQNGNWDVFSGLMASLHDDIVVTKSELFFGMRFLTINKMMSAVCNIYNIRTLDMLAKWDWSDLDDQKNTIDKYLERQNNLRVIVAMPFLAGHREEVNSTLWGFQNTTYREMISDSQRRLQELANRSMRLT